MNDENKDKTESINETDLIKDFNDKIQETISLNSSYLDSLYEPIQHGSITTSISKPIIAHLINPTPILERSPDYLITDKEMKTLEERLEERLDNLEKCVEKLNNENLALKIELSLLKLEVKKN